MNDKFEGAKSGTGIFVASAIWAAAIVASAYLCSMLLSIPGADGASFFWLPCIFMVTGAIWFGWYGMIAAAVGTFIGGALAGNPIAINIGQNPIPAFFANTLLLYYLFKFMNINLSSGEGASSADLFKSTILVAVTIIIAMIAGYYLAPSLGIWGRVIAGVICLIGWYFLAQSTKTSFRLDGDVFKAVIAVVIASVVSAAMGAYVWAGIGGMGAAAWTIVFPGWAMGDIVASILGLGVLFSLTDEMKRRGLSTY